MGDVVLIAEDKLPQNRWRMGVCTELRPGRDGLVRSCKVRTLTKGNRVTHIIRPIEKLYPLEILSKDTRDADVSSSVLDDDDKVDEPVTSRPKRAAGIEGEQRRRNAMSDSDVF